METDTSRPRCRTGLEFVDRISIVLLAFFFAFAQWRLVERALGDGYAASIHEAKSIVLGTPMWRVFQSRVLAPYGVEGLSYIVGGYAQAYVLVWVFGLTVAGCLAFYAGALIHQRAGGLISFFLFQCLFPLFLDERWLYVWDVVDIIVFFTFFILVLQRASWWWFVLLFAVAVFNRESALFIALWLAIDPVCRWGLGYLGRGPARPLDVRRMIAGAVCLVVGILTIETLRSLLLIEEIGTRSSAPKTYGSHFFLTIHQNFDMTLLAWHSPHHHLSLIVPILIVVTIYLIARVVMVRPTEFLGVALMSLAQVAANLFVGVIYETRIFLYLVPFLCVATVLLFDAKARREPRPDLMKQPISPVKSSGHAE